jgi:hypothetical protein
MGRDLLRSLIHQNKRAEKYLSTRETMESACIKERRRRRRERTVIRRASPTLTASAAALTLVFLASMLVKIRSSSGTESSQSSLTGVSEMV